MIDIAKKDTVTLRFRVGDRVECNCGQWSQGTIVKLFYTQSSFPAGKCVPYQIRLDDGRLIYSPADEDRVIRLAPEEFVDGFADEDTENPESEKLPVTIVTGFLGAGKTTLVNYILREQSDKKICVIENEFGAVSIDTQLVKENLQSAEEIITMDNGCACCTVRGDLVKAFNQLKDRKKDFDLILLETTGLADPAPVIKTIAADFSLQNNFRIDGVVCLVDCKFILEHLNEVREEGTVNEAVQQVAFSDRILLNKIDLVSKAQLKEVRETIYSVNSFAEQIETRQSKVPTDKLMGMNTFSLERFQEEMKEYDIDANEECTDENCTDETCATHGHHEHGHHEHGHGGHECTDACKEDAHGHADHGHSEYGHSEHGHSDHGHAQECEDHGHNEHGHAEKKAPKKKTHDLSGVGSIALISDVPLSSPLFNKFMTTILQSQARDVFRSKGVLKFIEEGNKKFVFQGVHEEIQFTEAPNAWTDDEEKVSKVVLIGRRLDREKLTAQFEACKASTLPRPAHKSAFFD